ncbi:GNAT family N-acetyltransferase [Aureispira anguillae]|uniref:GNAT family N-acetyltransferase n=1 Tax=Aureispira anguillae TaxID=2864201 RepID=A0A916DSW3_9BACT|nr:GNAT family N-acetyltransferase [Aureispira anguillae]BDS12156.1 GNAT family N-acetyltransferase [Aureispira anguillae]
MTTLDKNQIKYRLARPSDALCLSVLFRQVYMHNYAIEGISADFSRFIVQQFAVDKIEQKIQNTPNCMLVAEYKNNLAGVAEIEYNKKCPVGDLVAPELNKLYVLECFTGLGVGHQLLDNVEQQLQQQGHAELWLWVYAINDRAIRFYERKNYQWIGNAFFELEGVNYENKVMHKNLTTASKLLPHDQTSLKNR